MFLLSSDKLMRYFCNWHKLVEEEYLKYRKQEIVFIFLMYIICVGIGRIIINEKYSREVKSM